MPSGAFDDHLRTPHYARFKETTEDMIADRVLLECDLTENARQWDK
jgi:quinol monooxygenase YgiN